MHFEPNEVYHVYNRGNRKQQIFFQKRNYLYFLKKIKNEWPRYCEILSYCLMPNHFHFMLVPNENACETIVLAEKASHLQYMSKQIGMTLSSYTKAINIQNSTSGNLFQKKTKAKILWTDPVINEPLNKIDFIITCFFYIHQNPLKAGLVNSLENWDHSSWQDYAGLRNGNLCNQEMLYRLAGLSKIDCLNQIKNLNENIITDIF
ncbi:transposase [soil metagenome]